MKRQTYGKSIYENGAGVVTDIYQFPNIRKI